MSITFENKKAKDTEPSGEFEAIRIDDTFFKYYNIPSLPNGYGYKGGVARAALFWHYGYELPIRDLDLMAIEGEANRENATDLAREYMPRDFAYGDGVEFVDTIEEYFDSRDFTINEVALFGNVLYVTKRAKESIESRTIHGSDYELRLFDGRLGPKLALKALLLKTILDSFTNSHWEVEHIEDTYYTEFYLALALNKALSLGEEIALPFITELKDRNIIKHDDDIVSLIESLIEYFKFDYDDWPDGNPLESIFDEDETAYDLAREELEVALDSLFNGSRRGYMRL